MQEKEKISIVSIRDFVIVKENLYYISDRYNGLLCKNLITGEISFLGLFPDEGLDSGTLYGSMMYNQGKIIFIPYNAKNIAIYEICSGKFINIDINQNAIMQKYWNGVIYDKYIYMFPHNGKKVLCLNVDTEQVESVEAYSEVISMQKEKGEWSLLDACIFNGKIYASVFKTNLITEYDLVKKEMRLIKLMEDNAQFASMCCDNEYVYISLCNKKEILCWNPINNAQNVISYEGYLEVDFIWADIIDVAMGIYNKRIYVQPHFQSRQLQISFEVGKECVIQEVETSSSVTEMMIKDEWLCLLQGMGNSESLVKRQNLENGKVEIISLDCREADIKRLSFLLEKDCVIESEDASFEMFCMAITNRFNEEV